MKKIITFFVAVLLVVSLLTVGAFADEATTSSVYGATVETTAGSTVDIVFCIKNNTGFDSTKMTVSASAPLTITGISKGLMSGGYVNLSKGIINHASASPVTSDGVLFTVTVQVADDATAGTYPISLSVTRLNVNGESLNYTVSGGAVVIEAPVCDHDYKLTASKAPNCTEDGYETYTCSKCGDTYTNILPAKGHTPGAAVKENVVAASCSAEGSYDEVVYCSVCGAELSRVAKTSPKVDHKLEVSIKDDDYHTWTCKVCGYSYDEPHVKQEDDYHFWCGICGWEKEKVVTPTSPDPDEPILGDVESQFNFGAIALIVLACGATFVCKRKFIK